MSDTAADELVASILKSHMQSVEFEFTITGKFSDRIPTFVGDSLALLALEEHLRAAITDILAGPMFDATTNGLDLQITTSASYSEAESE